MFSIQLQWKEFNVNLAAIDALLRSEHEHYVGNQAHSILELCFSEEPDQEAKDAIQAYWDSLDEESEEAVAYKSAAEIAAEVQAAKEAGKAKLAGLGLTEEEIAALVG